MNKLKLHLKEVINSQLSEIKNCKCFLLDIPYYENIGDVLIWEGTESFIKENNIDCLYRTSLDNFIYRDAQPDTVILLQGGGNFGDIWTRHQHFRLKVLELYPNNPVLILPQTIYYTDHKILEQDADLMNRHKNLTICARDKESFELLCKYFTNSKNLLVPDMAYCIDQQTIDKCRSNEISQNALYLKRTDNEFKENLKVEDLLANEKMHIDRCDWPSMEGKTLSMKVFYILQKIDVRIKNKFLSQLIDIYANKIFRPIMLKVGIGFVSKYSIIYTTRLHVAILSTLLEKNFTFVDNSYGKNRTFYQSWLSSIKTISFVLE